MKAAWTRTKIGLGALCVAALVGCASSGDVQDPPGSRGQVVPEADENGNSRWPLVVGVSGSVPVATPPGSTPLSSRVQLPALDIWTRLGPSNQ